MSHDYSQHWTEYWRIIYYVFSVKFDVIILTKTLQLHDPFMHSIQGYNTIYNYETLNTNNGVSFGSTSYINSILDFQIILVYVTKMYIT